MERQRVEELMCHEEGELGSVMRDAIDGIMPIQDPSVLLGNGAELLLLSGTHWRARLHEVDFSYS